MGFISMKGVKKVYPNGMRALTDINLEIDKGSFVVILGPSGAGKSTLLRALNGLSPATGGTITVDGMAVDKGNIRELRAKVGMVFQQFNLVERLYVMTNVLTGRLARRHVLASLVYLFKKSDHAIAREALARVGLLDKAWSRADMLSGGQQQRVGIARALAQKPSLILADEPVASLDPLTSREVLELLRQVSRDMGITVVANLHQVEFARQYADRIIGLNSGRLVFDDQPTALTSTALAGIYGDEFEEEVPHVGMALAYA